MSLTRGRPLWAHVVATDARVAWQHLSLDRIIELCGCRPPSCRERGEFEAGRSDALAGVDPRRDSLAYRVGYGLVRKQSRRAA